MTDPELDDVFEAYLKRRSVLPGLDDKPEPPAALDQKVLNEAREAIEPASSDALSAIAIVVQPEDVVANKPAATTAASPSRSTARVGGVAEGNTTAPEAAKSPRLRPPRWAVPIALAATILLCLSVVINISLNTNHRSPNGERMAAARADLKASALSNATAESDAAAGVSAPSPTRDALAANDGERRESISGGISSHEVVIPRAKVAGTPAPHAPVLAETSAPPAQTAGASGSLTPSAQPAANAPPVLASADAPPPQLKRSLADSSAPPTSTSAGASESERNLTGAPNRASGATASANSVAPVPPAERGGTANGTGGAASATPSAEERAVLMAKEAGVAAPQYTPAPEQERAAASARKAAKPAAVAPHPADPKVWLQQIEALRGAGKADQADAETRRFKAAFPNYPGPSAPPDLPN
jgi:hypothetical protein